MPSLPPKPSLTSLVVFGIIVAAGIGLLLYWWTKPYVLTGSYSTGEHAWEQWERRTLRVEIAHIKTVRFYR